MSNPPSRNGDSLILEMLSEIHNYSYSMGNFTIVSIEPTNNRRRNTAITITFFVGPRAGETVVFYYYRLNAGVQITQADLQITNGTFTTTRDLVAPINAALNLYLTNSDIVDEPLNISSYPAVVTVTAHPQSRILFGSGTVTLLSPDSGVGTASFLYGTHALSNSKEEIFRLFGFEEEGGIAGEVTGFNGAADNHDLAYDPVTLGMSSNGNVAYLGSNKFIDAENRTSHVIGFNIAPNGVTKVTGEYNLSGPGIGSYPLVAVTEDGRGYVAEVMRGSATGEYTLTAVEIVEDSVVQVGNQFSSELLVDVGMSYQHYGFKHAGIIDGHFIVTYKDEAGDPSNVNCVAFSFDGTDFSLVRSWTPPVAAVETFRVANGRLVAFPGYNSLAIYDYSASAGASLLLFHSFESLVPNGPYTAVTVMGYDPVTDRVWVGLYNDEYTVAALAVFAIDFDTQSLSEVARITGLDGATASPDLIYNDFVCGPGADWAGYLIRRFNGSILETIDVDFNPPAGTRFALPFVVED